MLYSVNAQVPQKMTYQAVIRNSSNNLLSLKLVGIRLSIIQNSVDGKAVYVETHLAVTNMNGLISIQIGAGVVWLGQFSNIDWSKGPYFVKTETDPEGGYDFTIIGTTELLSVPYALYAYKSFDSFDSTNMHTNILALQNQSIENKKNIQTNLDSIKANAQQIAINLENIRINTIKIKSYLDSLNNKVDSLDLSSLLLEYQKVGKFVSAISLQGVDSFDIKINGNLIASRNVTVGGNIESLGATSTLGTLEKPFKGLFISSGSLSIASDTLGKEIPPAVLSNVEGNLQISAGGLKLMGDNTSLIAPRIVSTLSGNASSASKLDKARKINGISFDGSKDIIIASNDTTSLSSRINLKVAITDTSAMLVPYYKANNPNVYITATGIIGKLNILDTTFMLSNRIARDTTSLSSRINLKLNTSDTTVMLVPYLRTSSLIDIEHGGTGLTSSGTNGQFLTSTGTGTLIWTTSTNSVTHFIGESFGGGKVFYLTDDGTHGLISEIQDQSIYSPWYDALDLISTSNNHSTEGKKFTDWKVPTKNELNLLYLQKVAGNIGGFVDANYWSSSEDGGTKGWMQNFLTGDQIGALKGSVRIYIRAVRSF